MRRRPWLWLLALLAGGAQAHESRPAYLEIVETAPGQYDLSWKVPRRDDLVLALEVVVPAECTDRVAPSRQAVAGAMVVRRLLDCGPGGLEGREIRIAGLAGTLTDALARVRLANGQTQTALVKPSSPVFTVDVTPGAGSVAAAYTVLGIEHILFGIDHLLFVLGLLLIVRGVGLLVKTITAFTVAHSLTLAAAALGFVRVPQAPVEAVIALSILFLATELARRHDGHEGLTERYPWVVALSFGLLHGFGFASALAEVGLPQSAIPLALFTFNLGVEIGQLVFIAAVFAVRELWRRLGLGWPAWARPLPAYGIGSLAAFWCIQRVAAF